MSEDHKKQLNILGEIRDQIKRLADLAEPTRIIFAKKSTPPDALPDSLTIAIDSGIASLKTMEFSDIEEIKVTIGSIIAEMEPPFDKYLKACDESTKGKTDDALVEAVKRFVDEAEAVVDEDMVLCDYDISITSFKRLEAAYAAHKQAGE